ncbi:MAG: hypothetical protein RBR50_01005 [Candidatus Izemoplasmatales bacterium]|nr:hypothetical protein [Candidatus Izemoplasmatales bacterium]
MKAESKLKIIDDLLTAKNARVCIYNFEKEILQYEQNGKLFQCDVIWNDKRPLSINNKEIEKLTIT